jgi:hypothetical protein
VIPGLRSGLFNCITLSMTLNDEFDAEGSLFDEFVIPALNQRG